MKLAGLYGPAFAGKTRLAFDDLACFHDEAVRGRAYEMEWVAGDQRKFGVFFRTKNTDVFRLDDLRGCHSVLIRLVERLKCDNVTLAQGTQAAK